MSASNETLGVTGTLTLIFVVLKLAHLIEWSWWWVLSPLWMSAAGAILLVVLVGVMLLVTDWLG